MNLQDAITRSAQCVALLCSIAYIHLILAEIKPSLTFLSRIMIFAENNVAVVEYLTSCSDKTHSDVNDIEQSQGLVVK